MPRRFGALVAFLTGVLCALAVQAGPVYLDYTNFETRLSELAASAGVTPFGSGEVAAIKSNIKSSLETAYSGFSGLSFTETDPGGTRAEIVFGPTASPGALGLADHIDFLNRDVGDTARVFSANFDFTINEFSGSTSRATQISQLSAALGGTAAHELGHNLGLRHHDAHGDLTYTGTPVSTGGNEDTHIMATGSTGLGETGRETARDFSVNSLVKLEYAAGTLPSNPTASFEAGDAGATAGTAQSVALEALPVSGRFGEVIIGTLATVGDIDWYAIELLAGSVLTADINLDYADGFLFEPTNTILSVLDPTLSSIAFSDNTLYSTTTFGSGITVSLDSVLYNVPIATTGTYYVSVSAFSASDLGDYQLLLHTDLLSVVPEPSSLALFGIGGLALLVRLRRRRSTC